MIERVQDISDERLMAGFEQGQTQAYDELVRRYYKHIYRFMVRFTNRQDLAEDLTQEIFLKLYRSAHLFDKTKKFKPWLFSIAANRARDEFRSISRSAKQVKLEKGDADKRFSLIEVIPGKSQTPEKQVIDRETAYRVKQAIGELPDQLREILILAYYEKMPYKEIAQTLDIPLGTVKSRLHKAVHFFGGVWKSYEPEST